MDGKAEGQTNNGLESRQQSSHSCRESRPPYEFYEKGIEKVGKGWIQPILAFLTDRSGGEVVAIAAILALFGIAREFIRNRNDGLDSFALIGSVVTIATIFLIVVLVMLRTVKAKHAKDTKENKSQKAQPGIGDERTHKNGTTTRRDRRT